jgi:hypothetical protein
MVIHQLPRHIRGLGTGIVVLTLLFMVNCVTQTGDTNASNNAIIKTAPGIQLKVSPYYPASGPIPVQVTMLADMPIYYANNGNIEKAMEVFLIRRDAPGILHLAKNDPHAIMEPEIPLPPPLPGQDSVGFIKEERILDVLAYGAHHPGGAKYYAVGILAGQVSDPQPLTIKAQYPMVPAKDVKPLTLLDPDRDETIPPPPTMKGIVVQAGSDPVAAIEGAFRVSQRLSADGTGKDKLPPFVTIVAARVDPHGGVSSGIFQLPTKADGEDWIGQFSVPASELIPRPVPGHYRVLVFSADEIALPVQMDIP